MSSIPSEPVTLENRRRRIDAFRTKFARLAPPDAPFDQHLFAALAEEARLLNNDVAGLRDYSEPDTDESWTAWHETVELFRNAQKRAWPPNFRQSVISLNEGDEASLETVVRFLEDDPWFFRSGYAKEKILDNLPLKVLSDQHMDRMRQVILNIVDRRDGREFCRYARFARHLNTEAFRAALFQRFHGEDRDVRRRAWWVLEAMDIRDEETQSTMAMLDALWDRLRPIIVRTNWGEFAAPKAALAEVKAIQDEVSRLGNALPTNKYVHHITEWSSDLLNRIP